MYGDQCFGPKERGMLYFRNFRARRNIKNSRSQTTSGEGQAEHKKKSIMLIKLVSRHVVMIVGIFWYMRFRPWFTKRVMVRVHSGLPDGGYHTIKRRCMVSASSDIKHPGITSNFQNQQCVGRGSEGPHMLQRA